MHEHIKDICRRFARLGYYAISPELFARQGDAPAEPNLQKLLQTIVYKKSDSEVASDLDATLAFAKASGSADVERVAVVGFCWGGRQAWLYAAHNSGLKAGVAWYGQLFWRIFQPTAVARAEQDPPDIAGDVKVPLLGLYGGKDSTVPLYQIEAMSGKLIAAGSELKIVIYPDAGHGFFVDYRAEYNRPDAEASWSEAIGWLRKHGV